VRGEPFVRQIEPPYSGGLLVFKEAAFMSEKAVPSNIANVPKVGRARHIGSHNAWKLNAWMRFVSRNKMILPRIMKSNSC